MTPIICPKCGALPATDDRICPQCGTPIPNQTTPPRSNTSIADIIEAWEGFSAPARDSGDTVPNSGSAQDGERMQGQSLLSRGQFGGWANRNPTVVASILMVLLSLALGVGLATRYSIRANIAREAESKIASELKDALHAQTRLSDELKTALTVSEVRRMEAMNIRNAEKIVPGNAEPLAKDLKKSLRQTKERLYLTDLRLNSARLRNAQDLWDRRNAQDHWDRGNAIAAFSILDSRRWDLRGWEFAHLQNRFEQTHFTLRGHAGSVKSVNCSSDGRFIVTGSWDNSARVWDAYTGEERLKIKDHTEPVWFACMSPDGLRIATSSRDKTVRVWDSQTGEERFVLEGHVRDVWSVQFSPDGMWIVTAGEDHTAKVWDALT